MRLPLVVQSLLSGALIYVFASACAAAGHTLSGAGDETDERSPTAVVRDAIADVVDGLTTPVSDARAEPTGPDVAVEPCTTVLAFNGSDAYFAVHAYDGKSYTDLATVRAITESSQVDVYPHVVGASVWVRNNSAAVFCSYVVAGPNPSTVTFVLPK